MRIRVALQPHKKHGALSSRRVLVERNGATVAAAVQRLSDRPRGRCRRSRMADDERARSRYTPGEATSLVP